MDELRELLFQLSISFSTASFWQGQPISSLIVYFSGILGFSTDAQNFLSARKFTPYLFALIYVQRLLFLEYAFPTETIHILDLCGDHRFASTNASKQYDYDL
jgi:hypothetical protein